MPVLSQSTVYQNLLNAFSGSSVVGKVPADGAQFGIVTGSAAEYARFGTAIANAESGFNTQSQNLGDPGGSFGIFQYAHGQVPGGNAFDPNASIAQFVNDTQSSVNGAGSLSGGILGARFSTIGSNPIGGLQGAAPLADVSQLAGDQGAVTGDVTGTIGDTGQMQSGMLGSDMLSGGTLGPSITGDAGGLSGGTLDLPATADGGATFADRFDAINSPDTSSGIAAGGNVTGDVGGNVGVAASSVPDVSATGQGQTSGGGLPSGAGLGSPVAVGFQSSLVSDVGGWVANVEKAFGSGLAAALTALGRATANAFGGVTNWFVRAFLIILGIILIGIGLTVLMWDHGGEQVAIKAAKVVAA